jgi:hypothetical protein
MLRGLTGWRACGSLVAAAIEIRLGASVHRVRRVASPIAFALALTLASASSAAAAPITLGAPLSTTTFERHGTCDPFQPRGCTYTAISLGAEESLVSSPVNGVITSWSIKQASAGPGYSIRTLTRSGSSFTGLASSAPQTPLGSEGIQTFPTSLPIKTGDRLGINVPGGGQIGFTELSGSWAEFAPALADGETRAARGEAGGELAFSAQVQPAPTITSITPITGPITGGTAVTILGTDFEGTSAVTFGAAPTSFAVNSEGSITATAPPASAGPVSVSVTTLAGTAASPQLFAYVAPAAPGPPGSPPASKCMVPRLKGKTLKAAKRNIRGADCSVGKLTKREGATAKTGEVVKQIPKPGATVPVDTKVKVTLAP